MYYPVSETSVPFKANISLSKRAYELNKNIYTIVDFLIEIGGFAKACFYIGMGIAMVSALRLY